MPRTAKPQRGPWRRFTLKLFWALLSGSGLRPFIYALRLGLFVLAMLPGFVPYFLFYLFSLFYLHAYRLCSDDFLGDRQLQEVHLMLQKIFYFVI